jgi:hypothetical protein
MTTGPPQDMLVFKADGSEANITSVTTTDTQQTLTLTDDIDVDNFDMGWPYQPRGCRATWRRWKTEYFDIFVVGDNLWGAWGSPKTGLYGLGPYGNYDGRTKVDIGPAGFLCEDAMDASKKPYNPTHELLHPLAHVCHTKPGGEKEIMNGSTSVADSKDATKHLADKPIAIKYQTLHKDEQKDITLDGKENDAFSDGTKTKDTPVTRFLKVGAHYRVVVPPMNRRSDDTKDA